MCDDGLTISFSLPQWIAGFSARETDFADVDARMRFAIAAARENVSRGTGGPFAAAVFESETGRLVSLGVNLVTTERLSILHAEMVAITVAQRRLATYDLGAPGLPALELVTTTEPCAMCLGAIPWSGLRRVISAATDADARAIGFDEGPKVADWRGALSDRGIQVVTEIHRAEARAVLEDYARGGGVIYNSRG